MYRRRQFYLDDKLFRIVRISRPRDLVECWDYEGRRVVAFPWSMVKRDMTKAYSSREVAGLLGLHIVYVRTLINRGRVRAPLKTYGLRLYHEDRPTEYAKDKPFGGARAGGRYWWNDRNILELHEYLLTTHFGRPRHDGKISPRRNIPSKRELLAKLRNETVLYIKSDDGNFDPVWKESDFGK